MFILNHGRRIMVLLALSGCFGASDLPELGDVTGVVTLDDEPLSNASVEFIPENRNPSIGLTDEQGRYKLTFHASADGALIGRHEVKISTFQAPYQDNEGTHHPAVPERVPARYNKRTELEAEVGPGHQELNFALTSDENSSGPSGKER
jgi:hypothetical protein